MRKALLTLAVALTFALSAAACDDGETNTSTNQSCSSAHLCVNGACNCGQDGSGQACTNPDDTTSDDADNCTNRCEVCE